MGERNYEAESRYLALSAYALSVVEQLIEKNEDAADLEKCLSGVCESLGLALESSSPVAREARDRLGFRPFRSYEDRTTLYDVLGGSSTTDAFNNLRSLLKTSEGLRDNYTKVQPSDLDPLITFFRQLSIEALHRSRRSPSGIPPRIRELCRKLKS